LSSSSFKDLLLLLLSLKLVPHASSEERDLYALVLPKPPPLSELIPV